MKTLFYSVVMILLWGCTKQENFSEQSIPEIGSEHNKILDEILKEIHQKTFED